MAKEILKNCEYCGKEYIASYHKQKHCSKECSGKARGTRKYTARYCPVCENKFYSEVTNQRFCSVQCSAKVARIKNRRPKRVCVVCGKEFNPKRTKQDCCGRECGFELIRQRGEQRRKITQDIKFYRRLALLAKRNKRLRYICVVCNKEFLTTQKRARCCSESCKQTYYRVIADYNVRKINRFTTCPDCGLLFIADRGQLCCIECSEQREKQYKKTYRRRRKGWVEQNSDKVRQPYSFNKVNTRDKGICQKCFMPVSRSHDVNDDLYPNIDHIIPLSKGGADSFENVRLLCRKCNLIKGDNLDGEWEHRIGAGAGQISRA